MIKLTPEGLQLILDFEVGGGQKYYDKFCRKPTVPGGKDTTSGITIGIGFDIAQHSHQELLDNWGPYLPDHAVSKLLSVNDLKGDSAKKMLPQMQDIIVPWEAALEQFQTFTVLKCWSMTQTAFPEVEEGPQCVQESLLDLVFNRGGSVDGPKRFEMRTIRSLVASKKWDSIPEELREMKRLWPDTKQLCDRREAEAKHIEAGLNGGSEGENKGKG
jgi:hypothetical protein